MPTLPEADRLFHTTMNGKKVWVIEDCAAFTLMFPGSHPKIRYPKLILSQVRS